LKPKPRSEDGAGDLGAKREAFHCEGLVDILFSYRPMVPDEKKRGSTQGIVKTIGGIVLLGFGGLLHYKHSQIIGRTIQWAHNFFLSNFV